MKNKEFRIRFIKSKNRFIVERIDKKSLHYGVKGEYYDDLWNAEKRLKELEEK